MTMTQPPPNSPDQPQVPPGPRAQRIQVIDSLRGFALLGILIMNMISFAGPDAILFIPTVHGSFEGLEKWLWIVAHLFADQKFMTIFGPLYGAGILLFTTNLESRGIQPGRAFRRRSLWLLAFGLMHWYLLWDGDILVIYALAGMAVYGLRHRPPTVLAMLGVLVIGVHGLLMLVGIHFVPEDAAAELYAAFAPSQDMIEADLALIREPYAIRVLERIRYALEDTLIYVGGWGIWRAGGLMLMGMAAWKLHILSARQSDRTYISLTVAGLLVGLPVVAIGVGDKMRMGWDVSHFMFGRGYQYNYWASILVSAGYIGIFMLAQRRDWLPAVRRWLAAVGRMAFTNYIMQTVICVTVFQGFGGVLYGTTSRLEQTIFILGAWVFQVVLSVWWLKRFRHGPLEWLWRTLTYGRVEPFRSSTTGAHG